MTIISIVIHFGAAEPALVPVLARDLEARYVDLSAVDEAIVGKARSRLGALARMRLHRPPVLGDMHASGLLPYDPNWSEVERDHRGAYLVLGWVAAMTLAGRADVARVCLSAPRSNRQARIARALGLSPEAAARVIDGYDASLTAYARASLGHDDGLPFDLVIDASRFDRFACASLLTECVKARLLAAAAAHHINGALAQSWPDLPQGDIGQRRRYALVEHEQIDLSAADSQEAAIAAIESRLHHECHHRRN
ncbi:MAG: cytidylate kinase family protein [Hyphomicrobiaceae bacterium]